MRKMTLFGLLIIICFNLQGCAHTVKISNKWSESEFSNLASIERKIINSNHHIRAVVVSYVDNHSYDQFDSIDVYVQTIDGKKLSYQDEQIIKNVIRNSKDILDMQQIKNVTISYA